MGFEGSAAISSLNRRGGEPRRIASRVDGLFDMTSNRYPSRGVFIQKILRTAPQVYYYLVSTVCEKADVIRKAGSSAGLIPAALDTEHPVDVGFVSLVPRVSSNDLATINYITAVD